MIGTWEAYDQHTTLGLHKNDEQIGHRPDGVLHCQAAGATCWATGGLTQLCLLDHIL